MCVCVCFFFFFLFCIVDFLLEAELQGKKHVCKFRPCLLAVGYAGQLAETS